MPTKQINDYTLETNPLGTESIPIQTASGVTKRIQLNSILDCYGMIQFQGVGTDHNPTTTPEKIVDFNQELGSVGVTAAHSTDSLTINSNGTYSTYVHIEATVTDAETYTLYVAKNDIEFASAPVDIERKLNELSIVSDTIMTGLVAGDIITFYVASTNAGGASFIPNYLKLKLVKIGT